MKVERAQVAGVIAVAVLLLAVLAARAVWR